MQAGQVVQLQAYGSKTLQRVVVAEEGDTVYVCLEKEFEAAKRENREPKSVGFNRRYVIRAQN